MAERIFPSAEGQTGNESTSQSAVAPKSRKISLRSGFWILPLALLGAGFWVAFFVWLF